ncbi:MAG: NYN domain-containing protein, partial [Deltaproteobacteria bacterium]|nr:NYN domain-containing protein [Deltaproteobacteria bacterium]
MHLNVDGYNVIRQTPRLQLLAVMDLQAGREALLELLAHYRRRSQHQITVVFDGWQHGDLKESRDRYEGILIIYSRRGERADEVMKRLLTQERERALVVTSDREIQVCAEQARAAWINASQFELSHLHDPAGVSDPDAEASPSARGPHKKGPARRLSKRLRQRQQRLKKL